MLILSILDDFFFFEFGNIVKVVINYLILWDQLGNMILFYILCQSFKEVWNLRIHQSIIMTPVYKGKSIYRLLKLLIAKPRNAFDFFFKFITVHIWIHGQLFFLLGYMVNYLSCLFVTIFGYMVNYLSCLFVTIFGYMVNYLSCFVWHYIWNFGYMVDYLSCLSLYFDMWLIIYLACLSLYLDTC